MRGQVAAITLLFALPVQAQQPLPQEVQAAIDEAKQDCSKPVRLKPGFTASKDINGDGKPDYILNYEKFECGGSITDYCGSAGCLTQVFASLPDGAYAKVWDENVRAIRFASVRGKPAMIVDLHGSACNKVGAAPCPKTLLWDGKTFADTR